MATIKVARADTPRRRLKVLHIGKFYPPHMGGIESHLETLCREIQGSCDIQVLVASDDRKSSEEVLDGIPVSRSATRFSLAATPFCPAMIRHIRHSDADIVHIHLPNPMAVIAYLLSRHPGRLVVTYHSDTVRHPFLGALFTPLLLATLRRSAAIITSSQRYQDTSPMLSRFASKCRVIPFGISLDGFERRDEIAIEALRKQYGDRFIVSVGRLVYYKGFEHLIRAMKQVACNLVIIGDGPLRSTLEDLARKMRVDNKVFFLGKVPGSLVPFYQAAELFVLPSIARSEAFAIVQIEAMAAGLPVVNTMLDSGVPFVSVHAQTGLTVPPADSDALAAAINRLLDIPELCQSLGRRARQRAHDEFALNTMIARTLVLYEAVTAHQTTAKRRGSRKDVTVGA